MKGLLHFRSQLHKIVVQTFPHFLRGRSGISRLGVDRLPLNHSVSDDCDKIASSLSRSFRCTSFRASNALIKYGSSQTNLEQQTQRGCQREIEQNRLRHFLFHGGGNLILRLCFKETSMYLDKPWSPQQNLRKSRV